MGDLLGMSMAPIGEAFRELARDGLIETESRWGTRVRRLDLESIRAQHVLRTAIECEAIRQAASRGLGARGDELAEIASELDERVAAQDQPEVIFELDSRFHLELAQLSGVMLLVETLKANQLVRLLALGCRIAHRRKSPPRQHQDLLEAARSGDPDHAERVMRAHCVHSMSVQMEYFAAGGMEAFLATASPAARSLQAMPHAAPASAPSQQTSP
jgi:DNA-binding GntR family transcriptional regulator